MVRPGLDVHCCRSRQSITYGWDLAHGQDMGASRQPGAIAVTLCDVRDGPAIDLQIESEIPSKVRRPVHGQVTRWNVTGPEVTRVRTGLRHSADENCALQKVKSKERSWRSCCLGFMAYNVRTNWIFASRSRLNRSLICPQHSGKCAASLC